MEDTLSGCDQVCLAQIYTPVLESRALLEALTKFGAIQHKIFRSINSRIFDIHCAVTDTDTCKFTNQIYHFHSIGSRM